MFLCYKCRRPIEIPGTHVRTGRRLCDDCILLLDHVTDPTTNISATA